MSDHQSGFTLIEVLITTFIMAVLSIMGLMMMNSALASKAAAENAVDAVQELELARAVIRSDLAQVTSRRARDAFGGDPRRAFADGGLDDRLVMSFVRNGREAPVELDVAGASALQYVEYRFEDGALIRRSRARIDATPGTPYRDRVLLNGVDDLTVEYFGGAGWMRAWSPTSAGAAGLDAPPAIALNLTLSRFGQIRSVFLTPAGL